MRYLVQTRERIFVKGYGFLYFAKNMGKNIKIQLKMGEVNTAKQFLIMVNNLHKMNVKLLQKE